MKKGVLCFLNRCSPLNLYFILVAFGIYCLISPQDSYAEKAVDIELSGEIYTEWDDNINTDATNELDDVLEVVELAVDLNKEGKTSFFNLGATFAQELFWEHDEFNNFKSDIHAELKKELSKNDTITFNNKFITSEKGNDFADEFGRTPGRYRAHHNKFDIEYEKDLTSQTSLVTIYENENYTVTRSDLTESVLNKAGVEINHYTSSALMFILGYEYMHRDYSPGSVVETQSALGGVRYYLTKQTYVEGRAGIDFIENENIANGDDEEPHYSIELVNELDERTTASIKFSQRHETNSFRSDVVDTWKIEASLVKHLYERLVLVLTGFVGEGDYQAGLNDEIFGVRTKLIYDLTKNVKFDVGYRYTDKDSNDSTRNYERNQAFFAFRWEF